MDRYTELLLAEAWLIVCEELARVMRERTHLPEAVAFLTAGED